MKVKIEKLDNFGRGIAYLNNKICFVENALPNEIVEIEIIKEKTKIIEARTLKVEQISPYRVKELCPYSHICGGCDFTHLFYQEENKFKEEKIKGLLEKYTRISPSVVKGIKYKKEYDYRNKVTLHGKENQLGLYKKNSNEIVEIDTCYLVNDKIKEIISMLKLERDITEAVIKTSNDEKNILLDLKGKINDVKNLLKKVNVLIINGKLITEAQDIKTKIFTKEFYVSSNSFFQINKELTEDLYNEVLNNVRKINPEKVLDLYCGTGTIGIYISEYCKEIIGIDYNNSNIRDAIRNKVLNKTSNISFICDKVENQINQFHDIDLIIVDPPRSGLDQKTKKYIKKIRSKTMIYVSCDPITLIRDLNDLIETYDIKEITPFNMFPKTYHCESVVILERRQMYE